ncbi:SAPK1 [Scenedesmus sp. PABB004]|nr:SAPK1 [Scenedesmus sp. PABB004]
MGGCLGKAADVDVEEVARANDATGGLAESYEVKHLLGSGSAGDAWLCRDRSSGELLAVKLMARPLPPLMGNNIMREVKIGAQLGKGHLNIVKPRELILTRTHLGLVMEYVAGGNMADYILKTILLKFGSFDTRDGLVMEEDEARYFFTQIINAVDYCHKNKVAHRDLKMDNTLLDDQDPPRIKLCDFGFAKWWSQEPHMSTITGTPDYMSPQLLGPKACNKAALYDGTKADIWAAGVMLVVMLIGRFPFEGIEMSNATNLEEVSAHVWRQQNTASWHDNPLIAQDAAMLSAECTDLLNRMFALEEGQRIDIPGIREHPWFARPLPPLYANAMGRLNEEQARIDQQVAAGAFVSRDRDSALRRMIYLAASRYSPEQEDAASAGAYAGASGGEAGAAPRGAAGLRKISLTSINPFEYESRGGHTDLATISDFFSSAGGADGDGDDGAASPPGAGAGAGAPRQQGAPAAAGHPEQPGQALAQQAPQAQQSREQQSQKQQQPLPPPPPDGRPPPDAPRPGEHVAAQQPAQLLHAGEGLGEISFSEAARPPTPPQPRAPAAALQ